MTGEERQAPGTSGRSATLADMGDLDVLKATLNEHGDVPQLILLLSPT